MLANPVVFWILAGVTVMAALAVVVLKNIVHSALFLVVSFLGVAGVYMLLAADFLAMAQILIYVGAIAILLVFGVMLTRRGDIKESNPFNRYKVGGAAVSAVLLMVIWWMTAGATWPAGSPPGQEESTVGYLAEAMLGRFVVPFELTALLLLVALIGAILLARGVKEKP